MAKSKLIVSAFSGSASLWLYLDQQLILHNSGVASVELEDDDDYVVSWFIAGPPGDTYSITISSPKEAEYQLTRNVIASGKDFGAYRFAVNKSSPALQPKPVLT